MFWHTACKQSIRNKNHELLRITIRDFSIYQAEIMSFFIALLNSPIGFIFLIIFGIY